MSKKEKIKKWLKENYKSLIGKIILVLFALFVVFSQVKNCYNHLETDTSLSSQPIKKLHLDDNDNLVSDNLLNINTINTNLNGVSLKYENNTFILNGTNSKGEVVFDLASSIACNGTYYLRYYNINGSYNVDSGGAFGFYVFDTLGTWDFDSWNMSDANYTGTKIMTKIRIYARGTFNNFSFNVAIYDSNHFPNTFEPYGLAYYSQTYIDNHYVSNEVNEQDKESAYNNGLNTNLKSSLIDLLDTNDIDGVYAYDGQNNIDYSVNYMTLDDGVRVDNLPSKKGLVIQYKRLYNVNTLRFSIPSTDFVANDNWEYIYFKVYLYNSSTQSFTSLDVFTNDTTSSSLYINGTFNGNISFDKIYIGYDFLSSITYTFESISLNSRVSHIYTNYYDTIYQLGYNDAVASGESFNNGYSEGYKDGEKAGIYQGQLMQTNFTLGDIMKSVISAPVEVLGTTLDFDIPGTNINIFSVVRLVITCLVIAFTIKFLRG